MKLLLLLLGRFAFLLACWITVLLATIFVITVTKLIQCLPSSFRRLIPSRLHD